MNHASRKGQSIIEATLAVSVLATGFLGILTLLSKSLFLSRVTSDDLTATYLASEGIEIAKNLIDHDLYRVPPGAWGTCSGACVGDGTYIADYTTGTGFPNEDQPLATVGSCPGPNLHFDPTARRYSYSGPTTTNFRRCIGITHGSGGNQVTVNSIVTWSTGPVTSQSLNLEDHFYNWHP